MGGGGRGDGLGVAGGEWCLTARLKQYFSDAAPPTPTTPTTPLDPPVGVVGFRGLYAGGGRSASASDTYLFIGYVRFAC